MITYRCDGCGREIPRHELRYTVNIDVRAAYEELEVGLAELVRDHRSEILSLIERLKDKTAKEIEESIYKGIRLDLCPSCQRAFIRDPLRFRPEQGGGPGEVDVDSFLRSLGYGGGRGGPESAAGP